MAGEGMLKLVKPRIQAIDLQAAVGWGFVAASGALWVVQPFGWIQRTFIDKPVPEEK